MLAAAAEELALDALEVRANSRSDTRGLFGMADTDGHPVSGAPSDVQLQVRIAAAGVLPERLCALVERGLRCSPVPNARCSRPPRWPCTSTPAQPEGAAMDALFETLRIVRLVGAIFLQARFTAPWCYQSPSADSAAPLLEPGTERVVIFHRITEEECHVELGQEAPLRLCAGDAVVFTQGDAHRMTSQPGLAPAQSVRLSEVPARRPCQMAYGGGATPRLICGYLACDARLARLLPAGLLRVLRVNVRGSNAGIWLEASLRYAMTEARSSRSGGEGVLAKLTEVLFIEVLRLCMNAPREGRSGWLAGVGVGDPIVGAALNCMHQSPTHAWMLNELTYSAASSRSVLAERFHAWWAVRRCST